MRLYIRKKLNLRPMRLPTYSTNCSSESAHQFSLTPQICLRMRPLCTCHQVLAPRTEHLENGHGSKPLLPQKSWLRLFPQSQSSKETPTARETRVKKRFFRTFVTDDLKLSGQMPQPHLCKIGKHHKFSQGPNHICSDHQGLNRKQKHMVRTRI